MAARTGMTNPIAHLRRLTNAGTAEWSDEQLQTELDRQQTAWRAQRLDSLPTLINSTYEYYDYQIPPHIQGDLEENAVDSGWAVKDGVGGTVIASNYSVNYQARRITFNASTGGSVLYLDARAYNVNLAAASVWRMKAGFVASSVDWQSDNHRVSASQEAANCLKQAEYYEQLGGAHVGRFVRSDEV